MTALARLIVRLFCRLIGEERMLHYVATGFNKNLIALKFYGYLFDMGWMRSLAEHASVDKDGNPIPWLSYPALDFICERLNHNLVLFEYGGGASTLFFSKRVKWVHTVESDKAWADSLRNERLPNVTVHYESVHLSQVAYVEKPGHLNQKFDIIVVDGVHREACLAYCADQLTPGGVIILDDVPDYRYEDVMPALFARGFRKIDFSGISALASSKKVTAIVYRDRNLFGI